MLKCCLQDHEGKYVEYQPNLVPERELTKHSQSSGMVFEANKATGDYHDNMGGHVFRLWVKHKFLPTMLKKGNKKKSSWCWTTPNTTVRIRHNVPIL